jgi:serine protease Do
VLQVQADGPAENAGIRRGDVILSFDGVTLEDRRHLSRVVGETPVDKLVDIVILRDREQLTLKASIGRLVERRFAHRQPLPIRPAEGHDR